MTEQELDQQLRQLFEAELVTVDPQRSASAELRKAIVAETPTLDLIERKEAVTAADASIIDLAEAKRASTRTVLLVAAAIVLAIFGISLWALPGTDDAPLISDDFDVNSGAEIVPEGFIEGPDRPLIIVDYSGLDPLLVQSCLPSTTLGGDSPAFEGAGVLGTVNGAYSAADAAQPGESSEAVIAIVDAVMTSSCKVSSRGAGIGSGDSVLAGIAPDPVILESVQVETIDGEARGLAWGRVGSDVESVGIVGLAPDEQTFLRFGDEWFRLDFLGSPDIDFEITFDDGTTTEATISELTLFSDSLRCDSADCVAEGFAAIQAEAFEQAAVKQAFYLESGVLSQAEYDAAERSFLECLDGGVELGTAPTILDAESDDAALAQSCYDDEITFVERARLLQNGTVDLNAVD